LPAEGLRGSCCRAAARPAIAGRLAGARGVGGARTLCNAVGHADGTADGRVVAGALYSDPLCRVTIGTARTTLPGANEAPRPSVWIGPGSQTWVEGRPAEIGGLSGEFLASWPDRFGSVEPTQCDMRRSTEPKVRSEPAVRPRDMPRRGTRNVAGQTRANHSVRAAPAGTITPMSNTRSAASGKEIRANRDPQRTLVTTSSVHRKEGFNDSNCAYGCAYRLVSTRGHSSQFVSAPTRLFAATFSVRQPVAVRSAGLLIPRS
jgi:hypothetical protein